MIALPIEDAEDLRHPEDWIREKIERFDRDERMSLWAAVERGSGRAVALAGLQWEQIDGRRYAFFVRGGVGRDTL